MTRLSTSRDPVTNDAATGLAYASAMMTDRASTRAAPGSDFSPARLSAADIAAAASRLQVTAPVVHAVKEVESRAAGFLPDGLPTILFERHVMYRELRRAGLDADRWASIYPELVNRTPGGYAGGAVEHSRLKRAMEIDQACALSSASWGLFQIMGFHWRRLGHASVHDFIDTMCIDEVGQLDAFVRFIETDVALHTALKCLDWATFARVYNGPGYQANRYDVKLAQAYAKYVAQADAE